VKAIVSNEITNSTILKSIEDYESGDVKPTSINLAEFKKMINA